jgi:hypothetical protein
MDNELEIVPNEVITNTAEAMPVKTSTVNQYLPIAAGVGAGIVAGYLLCRFVVTPLLAKIKDKKAAEKAKNVTGESEPKAEES